MTSTKPITSLRALMQRQHIQACIIYTADPHMSEYLPAFWKFREWVSGFTGSAGTLVVTADSAGLWTDSRYFVQAAHELKGSGITLFKQGTPNVPEYAQWLSSELQKGDCVATNGLCCSNAEFERIDSLFSSQGIKLVDKDLLTELWTDRPQDPQNNVFIHEIKYSGKSVADKLMAIRKEMQTHKAHYHLISSLDNIAWLYNLRGNDISYNPVVLAYTLLSQNTAFLYIDEAKITTEVKNHLDEAKVTIKTYEAIYKDLQHLNEEDILLLAPSTNRRLVSLTNAQITKATPPSLLLKSTKNDTEIKNIRSVMIKDGVAMVNFLHWLDIHVGKAAITELHVAGALRKYRSEQAGYIGESFGTIAGYNAHGAIVHYSATEESNAIIDKRGSLLVDSGGQYLGGTTDITRTIPLDKTPSQEYKTDYTLVLKGMINLSMACFPQGTRGCNIDAIARQALWQHRRNYGHGTGHGVGCFLNVHEGPQSIRQELNPQALLEGMICSNEPGLYREGKYGIRHENLILCTTDQETEFGKFLKFETLTLCPFYTHALDTKLLTEEEKDWLNAYHDRVYKLLAPHLAKNTQEWLAEITKKIHFLS